MTIVVVALIGAGVLFITSAIENCSIVSTFTHIIHGDKIDWSGKTSPCSDSNSNSSSTPSGNPTAACTAANEGKPDSTGKFLCHNGQWEQVTSV